VGRAGRAGSVSPPPAPRRGTRVGSATRFIVQPLRQAIGLRRDYSLTYRERLTGHDPSSSVPSFLEEAVALGSVVQAQRPARQHADGEPMAHATEEPGRDPEAARFRTRMASLGLPYDMPTRGRPLSPAVSAANASGLARASRLAHARAESGDEAA